MWYGLFWTCGWGACEIIYEDLLEGTFSCIKGPLGRRDPAYQGRGDHNGPRSFSRYIQSAERYKR
jgi:hypothetical protein